MNTFHAVHQIENKEQKLTFQTVNSLKLFLEYYKDRFWVHFYSTCFLKDRFSFTEVIDISSYVDDNTPYVSAENVDEVIDSLEQVPTHYFNGTVLKIEKSLTSDFLDVSKVS